MTPFIMLAYFLKTLVSTEEGARFALCFTNIDGTLLLVLAVFTMLHGIGINIKPWMKIVGYGSAFLHMSLIWFYFKNELYYKTVSVIDSGQGYITKSVGGPLKIIHYVYLVAILSVLFVIFLISFFKKGSYSRRALIIYSVILSIGIMLYAAEILLDTDYTLLPYLYAIGAIVVAYDYDYIHSHEISGVISTYHDNSSERGFVALGLNKALLTFNNKSLLYLPFLKELRIDASIETCDNELVKVLLKLIADFEEGKSSSAEIRVGDMICICDISYFSVRKNGKNQGYLLDIRDATEEKKNLEILTGYNDVLSRAVEEKTANIKGIQRKIVLGMANMIENRDNNTGGHVKRTSDIISILIDEIKKEGHIKLDNTLAKGIVRAAPMHDLGKLHIDSNILCKPGKLTDEEYATMKTHSTKSGEMVMILLDGVEEENFVKTAFNLARYHHERWDGKGYPEGLVGTMIPIEARIMAVADVYDALVSKRCYKEPMSFEKARAIMCEGMGTQFDPNMKEVFLGCIDKLEEYYSKANAESV